MTQPINNQEPSKKTKSTALEHGDTPMIGFRFGIKEDDLDQLLSERATRAGVSVGQMAKTYVTLCLKNGEPLAGVENAVSAIYAEVRELRAQIGEQSPDETLSRKIEDVEGDLLQLRHGFAAGVRALLIQAGKLPDKEAEEWVNMYLTPR